MLLISRAGSRMDPSWRILLRIRGPDREGELRGHLLKQEEKLGSWDNIQIASVLTEKSSCLVGKTVLQAARESGREPFDFILDLVVQENDQVGMINFSLNEETFKRISSTPGRYRIRRLGLAPYGHLSFTSRTRAPTDLSRACMAATSGRKYHVPGSALENMTSLTSRISPDRTGRIQRDGLRPSWSCQSASLIGPPVGYSPVTVGIEQSSSVGWVIAGGEHTGNAGLHTFTTPCK